LSDCQIILKNSTKVYKELEVVCLRLTVVWSETMSQAPVGSPSEEGWNRRHKSVALGGWGRERPANRFSFPLPSESMEWNETKRKLDLTGASEMNRLYPNSRRESGNENQYLNTLPAEEDGGRSWPDENETKKRYAGRNGGSA
ncbi:hypothetical protein TNCV_2512341, partial [Trichonephila clavipes]